MVWQLQTPLSKGVPFDKCVIANRLAIIMLSYFLPY